MNIGFMNEYNIMNKLHNKRFCELDDFWKKNIVTMFNKVEDEDLIKCRLVGGNCKTDFEIIIKDKKKNLSVKRGENVSIHSEHIDSFLEFLKIIDVSDSTLKTIRLYHYGDGTLKGNGSNRKNAKELQEFYKEEIKEANIELNQNEIIKKVIYRAILKGRSPYHEEIDYLYHGNTIEGKLVSKEQLLNEIKNKCMYLECIHFGPFIYQPLSRFLYSKSKDDYKRHYIQLKWHTIDNDTKNIVNKT